MLGEKAKNVTHCFQNCPRSQRRDLHAIFTLSRDFPVSAGAERYIHYINNPNFRSFQFLNSLTFLSFASVRDHQRHVRSEHHIGSMEVHNRDPWVTWRSLALINLAAIMERADEGLLPAVYREIGAAFNASPTALGTLTFVRCECPEIWVHSWKPDHIIT